MLLLREVAVGNRLSRKCEVGHERKQRRIAAAVGMRFSNISGGRTQFVYFCIRSSSSLAFCEILSVIALRAGLSFK